MLGFLSVYHGVHSAFLRGGSPPDFWAHCLEAHCSHKWVCGVAELAGSLEDPLEYPASLSLKDHGRKEEKRG